jgi:heme/copper-type cytochrome/quinol oxidase subunit 2
MGTIILVLFILLLLMCFCIYNWWFLREKNKHIPNIQKGKLSVLNNPVTWGISSLTLLLIMLSILGYELYNLIVNIMRLQK